MRKFQKLLSGVTVFTALSFFQHAYAMSVEKFLKLPEDQQLAYITGFTEGFVRFSLPKDDRRPRLAIGHCISDVDTKILLRDYKEWLTQRDFVRDPGVEASYFNFLVDKCPDAKPF
jgi:hypothetical protein